MISTVSSMLLFFVTTLQQQRVQPGFYQSFSVLHKCKPATHPRLSVFLSCAQASLCTWFHKGQTAAAQRICKASFHAKPQGSATALHIEGASPDCQNVFSTYDAQPSCFICGLPGHASCLCCEDKFCHSHIYQCHECQISFCGACLDLHSLEGHWSDSDTASAMADSMHRRSSLSQPMREQSSTHRPQRGFTSNRFANISFLASVQRNSQSYSWRSTIQAFLRRTHTRNYLAHSARPLFSIFALFSSEAAL